MTIPIDVAMSTCMGMGYSAVAAGALEEDEPLLASRPFKVSFGAYMVTSIIAVVAYIMAPDWMLMYYADHRKIPRTVQAGFFALYPVMFTSGFLLAPQLEKLNKGLCWKVLAGIAFAEILFILVNFKRLWYVGTIEEFEKGEGKSVLFHPLGFLLGAGSLMALPATRWVVREMKK